MFGAKILARYQRLLDNRLDNRSSGVSVSKYNCGVCYDHITAHLQEKTRCVNGSYDGFGRLNHRRGYSHNGRQFVTFDVLK